MAAGVLSVGGLAIQSPHTLDALDMAVEDGKVQRGQIVLVSLIHVDTHRQQRPLLRPLRAA